MGQYSSDTDTGKNRKLSDNKAANQQTKSLEVFILEDNSDRFRRRHSHLILKQNLYTAAWWADLRIKYRSFQVRMH